MDNNIINETNTNQVNTDLQEQGNNLNEPNTEVQENEEIKTFTQEQLNDIVEKRLAKERKRLRSMIEDDEAVKAELLKNRLQLSATKSLTNNGYPIDLVELMDYSSEDNYNTSYNRVVEVFDRALRKQIDKIFKSNGRVPGKTNPALSEGSGGLRSAFGLRGD